MVDLVPEADGHVAAARAALVRIDIQVFEGSRGGLFGDDSRRRRDDEEREGDGDSVVPRGPHSLGPRATAYRRSPAGSAARERDRRAPSSTSTPRVRPA